MTVLLGGDERRALRAGENALEWAGTLRELFAASLCDLRGIEGLGASGARKLAAASELARRAASSRPPARHSISSPNDVHALLSGMFSNLDREHFVVVLLDTKNRVISVETVSTVVC